MEATEEHRRILEFLKDGEKTTDMMCQKLGLSFNRVAVLTVEMVLAGWIVNTKRDYYALSDGITV